MRIFVVAALAIVAAGAAIVVYAVLRGDAETNDIPLAGLTAIPTSTPRPGPTPLPRTWGDGLTTGGGGDAVLLACTDENRDSLIDGSDAAELSGLEIVLIAGATDGCDDPRRSDLYAAPGDVGCGGERSPVLLWAIGSAGTDMLDPSSGESIGMLDIVNAASARIEAAGLSPRVVLSAAAIFGAGMAQTSMERWIAHHVAAQLDAAPCQRAVLIGHSHGGATVTSVTAALEDRYSDRMLGVLIDRTIALYDRPATEMPARTLILNFFQTNEGWHGERLDAPNVANSDESSERAPVALSDGGGGFALVSHKTLDDAPGAQRRIVEGIIAWLAQ